jgi:hypothetical protein
MKMRENRGGVLFGIVLIAVAVFLVLKNLGVLQFSIWHGIATYWPIGLGLVGIALIMRARWLAFLFLLLTILAGALYLTDSVVYSDSRELTLNAKAEAGVESVDLTLGYGAGRLIIGSGSKEYFLRNNVTTRSTNDPVLAYARNGTKALVDLKMAGSIPGFGKQELWDIELSPDVVYNIDMDYGASDCQIDISKLKVASMELESGATSTRIIFGDYPTNVKIGTGASSTHLLFPKGAGVVVSVEGGAISTNLDGFTKQGSNYFSPGFKDGGNNIQIEISAGAASVSGGFV